MPGPQRWAIDQAGGRGDQPAEQEPDGIVMPFGSAQSGKIDSNSHQPMTVSRAKATASQITIDALATIDAGSL